MNIRLIKTKTIIFEGQKSELREFYKAKHKKEPEKDGPYEIAIDINTKDKKALEAIDALLRTPFKTRIQYYIVDVPINYDKFSACWEQIAKLEEIQPKSDDQKKRFDGLHH